MALAELDVLSPGSAGLSLALIRAGGAAAAVAFGFRWRGLGTSLAAAGIDSRTHLSSLIFLRREGKWKDEWHQPLICSELLRSGNRTSGQALGKGKPFSQSRERCRSNADDEFTFCGSDSLIPLERSVHMSWISRKTSC